MDTAILSASLRPIISGLHKGLRKQMGQATGYSMTEIDTVGHIMRNKKILPTELAALARVKTQSMSQILKKLEEQKVIVRTPSEEDKRKVFISLTPFGEEMIVRTRYERDEWLKQLIDNNLTEKEKELLGKALPVLTKLIAIK